MFGFFLYVVASKHLFVFSIPWSFCILDGSLSLTRCRGYTRKWIMFYGSYICVFAHLVPRLTCRICIHTEGHSHFINESFSGTSLHLAWR